MKLFVNHSPITERPRLERGVYVLPFVSASDEAIYVAIDRHGREVDRRLLGSDERADLLAGEMERALDKADPPRLLKIA